MKLLVFTDIHSNIHLLDAFKKEVKNKKIDLVICTGDYTFFGEGIEVMTKKIAELGTDVLLIHGNHEYEEEVEQLSKKYKNIHFIHKKIEKIGEYTFIGHGGGGFSLHDADFVKTMEKITKNIDKKEKIVFLTHAPPYNTKLDLIPGYGHVGNKDYSDFIKRNNVILAISGHIHETFGKQDKLGKALLLSPGHKGKVVTLE